LPGAQTKWTASGGPLSPGHPLTLTWDNGEGLSFTRTISIDANYMFTIDDAVKNAGQEAGQSDAIRADQPHRYAAGFRLLHPVRGADRLSRGGLQEVKYASLTPDKPTDFSSTGGWLGFTDKYWLTALVPPQDAAIKAQFRHAVDMARSTATRPTTPARR
jgi:YidC/Oxa1 family membrane protein insertase